MVLGACAAGVFGADGAACADEGARPACENPSHGQRKVIVTTSKHAMNCSARSFIALPSHSLKFPLRCGRFISAGVLALHVSDGKT